MAQPDLIRKPNAQGVARGMLRAEEGSEQPSREHHAARQEPCTKRHYGADEKRHEESIAFPRAPGVSRVLLEQRHVPEVGLPHEVKDVAEDRDCTDTGVERDVGGHAAERGPRGAETNPFNENPGGEDGTNGVAEARNDAKHRVETDADRCPRHRDTRIEPDREAAQPR